MWYGYELVERAKNFFIDYKAFERHAVDNAIFYMDLYDLKNCMVSDLNEMKEQTNEQTLEFVFSEIFQFITDFNDKFTCFNRESSFYTSAYEACLFTSLCMFLNKTRRIKGESLNQFVLENSLYPYNDKNSEYYSPDVKSSDILMAEGNKLRKARNRRLSERHTYANRSQWASMPMDSEHEWALYCIFENKEFHLQREWALQHNLTWEEFKAAKDTLKRIGNLYNEINETLKTEKDAEYIDRIKKAMSLSNQN